MRQNGTTSKQYLFVTTTVSLFTNTATSLHHNYQLLSVKRSPVFTVNCSITLIVDNMHIGYINDQLVDMFQSSLDSYRLFTSRDVSLICKIATASALLKVCFYAN